MVRRWTRFPRTGEVAIWRSGNEPEPAKLEDSAAPAVPTAWNETAVAEAIASCRDPELRRQLAAVQPLQRRAADTLFHLNYYPTRFTNRPMLYSNLFERAPLLDLPFSAHEFAGVAFPS